MSVRPIAACRRDVDSAPAACRIALSIALPALHLDNRQARPAAMSNEEHFRKLERMYVRAPGNDYYAPRLTISHAATELVIPIDRRFYHSGGGAHGSVYFKALDDAAFFAVNSLVEDVFVLTVTFTTYLTGPISDGAMHARGHVVNAARSFFVAESVVCDTEGKEIGRGNGTFTRSRIHLTPEIGYF
jgi:acyl-coenzyme A thioesterase PaaI-like protein